jgi:hypothetical protein
MDSWSVICPGESQSESILHDGCPPGEKGVVIPLSPKLEELLHDSEANLTNLEVTLRIVALLQLGRVALGDEFSESFLELLNVSLLSEPGIAGVFTVAVAVLPSTLIGGEIGPTGTGGLGLGRV